MRHALLGFSLLACSQMSFADCDFTPKKDDFTFNFTAYGAPDKSYVVSKNTFKKYELASESGKLLGATIDIDATSLDTSNDLNNGMGGQWPPTFHPVRSGNVVNGLFNNFVDPGKIKAKISGIDDKTINLDVTMNGETKTIPLTYAITDGVLSTEGVLDILDFNGSEAFKKFEAICTSAWHKGKSWSDINIYFTVPVEETGC